MSQTLRADQLDLLERTQAAMRRHRHVCVQAGCGWGKGSAIAEIARRASAKGRRVLILADRRRLISQLSGRLEMYGVRHGVLMANMPDDCFRRHKAGSLVQVASKATLVSRMTRDGLPPADLVIVDETQDVTGVEYSALVRRYDAAYRLGFSATPVGPEERGLGDYYGELVCAMPVSKLIEMGIVVPFKVYAALDMKDVRVSGGKVRPAGDPVEQWKKHAGGKPTVVFAPNRAASRAVVESFCRAGIAAVHHDAFTPEEERDADTARLESGEITVVSQVGLMLKGVDVPCVSVVQLLVKCGSLVKYVQATQRAGRSYPGKQFATVIDHTACIFQHGFPDDDIEWSLSPGSPVKKAKKSGADGDEDGDGPSPFVCTRCGLCYSGAVVCPGCGCPLAVNRKMYQPDLFAHLVEVEREGVEAVREESVQRVWTHMLFLCARSGKRVKQLAAMFWKRTGRWPDEAGVSPLYDRADLPELVADVFPEYAARLKTGGRRDDTPNLFGEAA